MMIKNKNKTNKGFTIAELMTSVAIFSIISMILFLTFSSGQKHLTTSTSKLDSERGINLATQDINFSIRNGSFKETEVLSNTDGTGYIATSSASLYDSTTGNIINNDLSYDISGTATKLNWNFKIVYFTASKQHCPKCSEMGLTLNNKNLCPHKLLIKRYYTFNKIEDNNFFLLWSTIQDNLSSLIVSPYSSNRYDKILARNVIAFVPQINGKNITYSIKLFKDYNIVKNSVTEEKLQKTIDAISDDLNNKTGLNVDASVKTNVEDPLSHYTTQINYTAIPLNN